MDPAYETEPLDYDAFEAWMITSSPVSFTIGLVG